MESLQLQHVQISRACTYGGGSYMSKHQLSSSKATLPPSFASVAKLQGSGYNKLLSNNQKNSQILFKDGRIPGHRIGCCAPAHPSATYSSKEILKVHDDETLLLKKRGAELVANLRGSCIYLVGMMGSGKSTIGKVLADALGHHYVDVDQVIEEGAGGVSVAELFKQQDETNFRDAETKVLKQLSCKERLVVATGGGIVIRPENWSYLRHGVTVWLDVPLESLAERVVAAGTHSRPLLGGGTRGTSAYTLALEKLTTIFENRASCYANADTKVSFQKLATSLECQVRDLTPTVIVMQILEEINELLIHRKQK